MDMADLSEDFITLTQLNCVQQCSALIQNPVPRNYLTAATLFGLYCGILIYRSYRGHLATVARKAAEAEAARRAEQELRTYEDYTYEIPPLERREFIASSIPEPVLVPEQSHEDSLTAAS